MIVDRDGRILLVNAETGKLFGYRREDLLGENVERLIPERLREQHVSHREAYLSSPRNRLMGNNTLPLFGLRADGTEFPAEISLNAVDTGQETLVFCSLRDISERAATKELQRYLKIEETLSRLSATFINLPENDVDAEITHGLKRLIEALETDRATICRLDPDTGDFLVTHASARPGISYFAERVASQVLPWLAQRVKLGQTTKVEKPEDLPEEAHRERNYMECSGVKSSLIVPFRLAGKVIGGMSTDSFRNYRHWDDGTVSRMQDVADIFVNAMARKQADEELQRALAEVRELKERLELENIHLREEMKLQHCPVGVVGNSTAMRGVLKKVEQVAKTDTSVLLLGETGTGKELIAQVIHDLSRRKDRPMVKVNCAALPTTLIESELFGREKGAYTGALAREMGRFELADKSTIFLDEIAEMPPEVQSKLLRVLQEGEFERLGSAKTIRVDVRVIAATNRDLKTMIKEGRFREDLFYRLNVFPIQIPPLREHAEDIPSLVWHILKDLENRMGRRVEGVSAGTMRDFQNYSWPGNVRELRNVIERNLISNIGHIFRAKIRDSEPETNNAMRRLDEVEADYVRSVLQATRWRVRGHGGAAEVLGLKATTLEARLKKLGIRRPN